MFERMVTDDEVYGCRGDRQSLAPADNLVSALSRTLKGSRILVNRYY